MTFLEYVCEKILGPAERSGQPGESYWACPQCGSDSFHTMPDHPEYKHRFRCWGCSFRGDAADLLRHYFPRETHTVRVERLTDLREEYKRAEPKPADDSLPRGAGSNPTRLQWRKAGEEWADLDEFERTILAEAERIRMEKGLRDLGTAARYAKEAEQFQRETEEIREWLRTRGGIDEVEAHPVKRAALRRILRNGRVD